MKKQGVLHAELAREIAALGHKDVFLIGDAGFPIPKGVPIIDLALCGGVPTFRQTMDVILSETEIEAYTLAEEILRYNTPLHKYIQEKLPNVETEMISHVEFKERSKDVKFCIRTGEITPFPNIILRAGVSFPVEEE